jgi:hypothetical protein
MEELKDKALEHLDRNNDGKVDIEDFKVLEKKQKVMVIAVAVVALLVLLNITATVLGALFGGDEASAAPVEVVEAPADPEPGPVIESPGVTLSDASVIEIANAVAEAVEDPAGNALRDQRIVYLKEATDELRADMERLRTEVDAMKAPKPVAKPAPPKKKPGFLRRLFGLGGDVATGATKVVTGTVEGTVDLTKSAVGGVGNAAEAVGKNYKENGEKVIDEIW